MSFEQRHDRREAGHLLALLRGREEVGEPGAALSERLGQPLGHLLGEFLHGIGIGGQVDCQMTGRADEVIAQPRDRSELHPVCLLMHAHPGPEVGRVHVEVALDLDEVRSDEHELGCARGRQIVLAQHLGRHEGQQGAGLRPGDLRPDGGDDGAGLVGAGGQEGVEGGVEQRPHRVGVGGDPCRAVDDDRGRRVIGGVQARGLGHRPVRRPGRLADRADLGRGFLGTDVRPGGHQGPSGRLREIPVDVTRHVPSSPGLSDSHRP